MLLKVKMSKAIVRRGEVTTSPTISRSSASSSTTPFDGRNSGLGVFRRNERCWDEILFCDAAYGTEVVKSDVISLRFVGEDSPCAVILLWPTLDSPASLLGTLTASWCFGRRTDVVMLGWCSVSTRRWWW